jgi:hypothetical protein
MARKSPTVRTNVKSIPGPKGGFGSGPKKGGAYRGPTGKKGC